MRKGDKNPKEDKFGRNAPNRRVHVQSDGVWAFHILMGFFSDRPITIIDKQNSSAKTGSD
jgi:hypothetical protein